MIPIIDFYQKNIDVFQIFAAYLKIKGFRIDLHWGDDDLPTINSSMSNDGEGGYFRIEQYKALNPGQYHLLEELFPIKIRGYEFKKVAISDFEYDEDRIWKPSVSFVIHKDGYNVLSNYYLNA